jgi:hypothetical protein
VPEQKWSPDDLERLKEHVAATAGKPAPDPTAGQPIGQRTRYPWGDKWTPDACGQWYQEHVAATAGKPAYDWQAEKDWYAKQFGDPAPEPTAGHKDPQSPAPDYEQSEWRPPGDHPVYLIKGVVDELAELAATQPGGRNVKLYISAKALGEFADVDRKWLRGKLLEACEINGVTDDDGIKQTRNSIGSGFKAADAEIAKAGPRDPNGPSKPKFTEVGAGAFTKPKNGDPVSNAGNASKGNAGAGGTAGGKANSQPWAEMAARLLSASALANLPAPEPLIDGVLDQGTVALLYGKWGTLKTFIALDWAASVATGRPWQGRATKQRKALYVAAEGAFGYQARVAAWQQGWGIKLPDGDFVVYPDPVNLMHGAEVKALCALVDHFGYGIVVLDTLARCMVGADENGAKDCGVVIDALGALRRSTPGGLGVAVGVHHSGKDGKTLRGSSVLEGGADTVYFSSRDGAVVTLDREKRRDGPELDRHRLRFDAVAGSGSGVLSAVSGAMSAGDSADKLLSAFVRHFGATGATKSELRLVAAMAPATFHRAVNALVNRGDLINTGTDKLPFYKAR